MRVFLTGATGLLGSHVASRLLDRGHEVVALARAGAGTELLRRAGAKLRRGTLSDSVEALAGAMAGCDAVVHSAALVLARASWDEYRAVNVMGTERIHEAAAASGAARVVHVSSVAVYGGAQPDRQIVEEDWLAMPIPDHDHYARSKRDAERAAWMLHDRGDIRLTTVRPAVLYGERDRHFTPILARIVRWALIPLPGGGRTTVPVVYAGNAADGVVRALEREEAVGRSYTLAQDAPMTAAALVRDFARELGVQARTIPVPTGLLMGVAAMADTLSRLIYRGGRPRIRRGARLLVMDNPYDSSRARRDLDWGAETPHGTALARTAAWYIKATGRAVASA